MNPAKFYRALATANGIIPLLMLSWDAYHGQLGANSVNTALHITGLLSLIFLLLSLVITPLGWLTGWNAGLAMRRPLGLYGFFYSVVHVGIYVALDREGNWSSTWHELASRRFLQVGAIAVILMVPLAVTSTNSMVRRLGAKRWKRLHQLAYLIAGLGVTHYYLLVKSDVRQPLAFAGVLAGLLGIRFGRHYWELRRAASRAEGNPRPEGNRLREKSPAKRV